MKISKNKISRFSQLRNKKFRKEYGLFTVEGPKAVADTILNFQLENLVAADNWIKENATLLCNIENDRVLTANREELDKISSLSTPSDVIAIYKIPEINFLESEKLKEDFYLVLDGIQDPGNLGTIIRTAHWFGIETLFCSTDTVDLYNPKTIQSTMGSLSKVNVIYCDISKLLNFNEHLQNYALDLNGENIFEKKTFKPGFFIMGQEGRGLRENIRKEIDTFLTIPPANPDNHPDSLNVAIATAITLANVKK